MAFTGAPTGSTPDSPSFLALRSGGDELLNEIKGGKKKKKK